MLGLDLSPETLRLVLEVLAANVPQAEVWAYGSRVTGGNHAGSDLDLVIRNPADLEVPQPAFGRLISAFSESDIPILVEVVDWARLPATRQRQIEEMYVVLPKLVAASPG